MHACEHGFGVFGIYNSENLFATFGGKLGNNLPRLNTLVRSRRTFGYGLRRISSVQISYKQHNRQSDGAAGEDAITNRYPTSILFSRGCAIGGCSHFWEKPPGSI